MRYSSHIIIIINFTNGGVRSVLRNYTRVNARTMIPYSVIATVILDIKRTRRSFVCAVCRYYYSRYGQRHLFQKNFAPR